MTVPTFTLSDNTTIPAIGYGTGTKWYGGPSDQVSAGVATAIEAGFIHLDGAEMYKNEAGLGAGAKLSDPNERKKFYITTKVADGAVDIPKALDESLRKLGTSYVDLYLLHSPFLPEGVTIESAWEQLVAAQAAGKVRSIGVSNFRVEDLEKLAKASAVKPVVNQIEFSPYLQNQTPGIFKYAKAHNITLEAYSPLGPLAAQAKAAAGTELPLTPVLKRLADKYNRTPGQILLRWTYQNGVLPITTSEKLDRLKQALDIFSFELEQAEVDEISDVGATHTFRQYWTNKFFSDNERL
ncbi:hypothetical protein DV451_002690 [Geotrichum candidum]|uniref:NADP-dependent oxidoreductase domain-containing protein n=1 Tax=Geotrichum candidum TaxID=1173061 RepID=A0A9P5KSG6_GEOCN|nr:hypothetical protein DV451_002690 [Geotrichum candidum]KAF5106539.1 hypothetical protein DV453_003859 [Geotrichum candidum]